jgi:hypothetical protein
MPFTLLSASSISGGVGDSLRPNAKPLIINGDMAVSQRGTSFSSVGDGVYTLDRFETNKVMDAAVTITQETLTSGNAYLNGFKNAFKVDVTTADSNLTGTQRLLIQHAIEGQDLQALKFGTANAEKLTLAFWVKATKTGTNIVRLYAPDDNRSVSASYTVSSSNTWEHKVLNFPADTTGVIDNDNGNGLSIAWCIGAGADFQSGTLATTWGTQTAANDFVGQVNNLDSTSNNFHITGIQLEVGEYTSSTLPPFQFEDFGNNLKRCQRYFQYSHFLGGFRRAILKGIVNQAQCFVDFPLMRTSPSLTLYGQGSTRGQSGKVYYDSGGSGLVFVAPNETSVGSNGFYMNIYSPNTSYNYYLDGYEVSAEL